MKRFISTILIAIMIFAILPTSAMASVMSYPAPNMTLKNMEMPVLKAGQINKITLQFENAGAANSIVVTPQLGEGTPFLPTNITDSINVPNSGQPFDLNLNVKSDTITGTYLLKMTVTYNYLVGFDGNFPIFSEGVKDISIYVRIESSAIRPMLVVKEVSTDPVLIAPGQTFVATVFYENIGDADINNVETKLTGLSQNGLFLSSGSDTGFIRNIKAKGSGIIKYNLRAAGNIPSGTQELAVDFTYNGKTETQKIYITLDPGSTVVSNLAIENLVFPTRNIGVNGEFVLTFDVKNDSTITTSNIIVKAESTDSAVVPRSTSIIKLNSIEPGKSQSLKFVFSPTESSITRNYPIRIVVEYGDQFSGGEKYSLEQYVGINVYNPADDGLTSKPKLIVDKYSFEPGLVKAGENFEMNLSFFNTNSSKTVRNIKIFLTASEITDPNSPSAGGSVFTPVDSSNTFYIDSIAPKGKSEKRITMFTVPDALAKTYTLTAHFEYEDTQGNEYTATELIGVPVVQQSKLDTGEVGFYPEAYVGQSMPISLEFYNTGKVTLYNMMVKIEGDFQTENAQYYVGNFNSGSSDYFEGYIIPSQPGELTGDVVFTYEDSTGQMQEVRKPFSLNVMEMMPMPDFPGEYPPYEEPRNEGFMSKYGKFVLPLGALVLVIGGIVVFRKRKAKKSIEDMEIDE